MASLFAKPVQDVSPIDPAMLQHIALPDAAQPAMPVVKMPQVTEQPTPMQQDIANTQQRLEKVRYAQTHPWGTPENHPGKLGKIAHGFSVLGNVAGDVFAPNVMARIPGTEMHMNEVEGNLENRLKGESEEETKEQQEQSEEPLRAAQTENLEHPPSTPLPTSNGYYSFNPRSGETQPINGQNGQPLQPYVKPGPRQHVFLAGPTGEAVAATFDPQTGTYYDAHDNPIANPQPYEKPTPEHPQAGMYQGAPAFGVFAQGKGFANPDTGAPMPGFQPTPNYGQMVLPTKTATFIGPDGIPREYQYNEGTQTYDRPLGMSASNAYGHEAAQAGAVDRAGDDLIRSIQQNAGHLGNTESIIRSAILNTPWSDPKTAELRAQIQTFAALQPSMHGFKGTDALRQFEKILGGIPNNPQALIAAIHGIQTTAGAINPDLNKRNNEPNAQPNQYRVGQKVKLNGQEVTIKKIYPDGTFDY